MSHLDAFWAFVLIGLFLLAGKFIKSKVAILEALFLPSSIIAGFLALALGSQGVGLVVRALGYATHSLADGLFPEPIVEVWRGLPGLLINVVFAALFLGKPIPGARDLWVRAGPQVAFGQTLAWGQYVVGISLCMLILTPAFGISPLAGALIEISFEGGHGTATGMAGTFRELGFPEGADLALGLATVGLVSGVVAGTVLINWAARRGHIDPLRGRGLADVEGPSRRGASDSGVRIRVSDLPAASGANSDSLEELRELEWEKVQEAKPTDPLSVHLGIVALAIVIGWLIKQGLLVTEHYTWGGEGGVNLIPYVPLFPLAMIGGVVLQVAADRSGMNRHISRRRMNRISGAALDFTIVSALGTLSITALGAHAVPFVALAAAGILWNVLALIFLAPRLIPFGWFERGIGDFGQSMGVTVTGLLLMRMADPRNESGALESFGYKQLLFEPIVGGGLFTAASLPLIAQLGPQTVLALTSSIAAFWLIFGLAVFGRHGRRSSD